MNFYKNDMITAKENDELAEWRASFKENCVCAKAIDKALNDNYADNRLDTNKALDTVLAEYGAERVTHVLAAQVVNHDWDGRYHKDVKAWAKEQTKDLSADFMEDSKDYYLNAHPILIDGLATKVMQREIEMSNFLSDPEKMYDFKILSKEEFLASYSYLTEAEYDNTAKELALSSAPVKKEFLDKMDYDSNCDYEYGALLVANNYTFQNDGKECSGGVYLFEFNGEFYEHSFQEGKPDFFQKLSLAEAIESIKTSIHHSSVQDNYITQEAYEIAQQEQVEIAKWEWKTQKNLTEANVVATVIYEGMLTTRKSIYEVNGEYYLKEFAEEYAEFNDELAEDVITAEYKCSLISEEKAVKLINAWQERVEESKIGEVLEFVSIKMADKGEQLLSDKAAKKNNRSQGFDR